MIFFNLMCRPTPQKTATFILLMLNMSATIFLNLIIYAKNIKNCGLTTKMVKIDQLSHGYMDI